MTRRWPVTGVILAVLWVFVRGVDPAPEAVIGEFLLGLPVGLGIAYLFRRMYADRISLGSLVSGVVPATLFLLTFIREVVVANFDVAYRTLAPGDHLEPEVILVPLRVETDIGVTTIANSITVTPGTLTLDYDPEANALYVHAIDGRDPQAVVDPIRTWETYVLAVFDEPRSPADPAPSIAVYPAGERHPSTLPANVETLDQAGADDAETDHGGESGDR